jgi:hypothetical protein
MDGKPCHVRQQRDERCIEKAYVDFFLLSRAGMVLRTHTSYFGRVVATVGGTPSYVISKGSCLVNGTAHTTERCAEPKQPAWCLDKDTELRSA